MAMDRTLEATWRARRGSAVDPAKPRRRSGERRPQFGRRVEGKWKDERVREVEEEEEEEEVVGSRERDVGEVCVAIVRDGEKERARERERD